MRTAVDDNIEALSRAIMSEAQADADQVLTEARDKAEKTLQRAREQAEQERQGILARARADAGRLHGQSAATALLKSRTKQLERREQLLNEVFKIAQQDLSTIQQWSDYEEIAQQLLHEAIQQIGAPEVVIHSDPRTQAVLSDSFLRKYAEEHNVKIQVGDRLEKGLGTIVETADGHRKFDNTLETRLHRMRNSLRSSIYQLLMGESA